MSSYSNPPSFCSLSEIRERLSKWTRGTLNVRYLFNIFFQIIWFISWCAFLRVYVCSPYADTMFLCSLSVDNRQKDWALMVHHHQAEPQHEALQCDHSSLQTSWRPMETHGLKTGLLKAKWRELQSLEPLPKESQWLSLWFCEEGLCWGRPVWMKLRAQTSLIWAQKRSVFPFLLLAALSSQVWSSLKVSGMTQDSSAIIELHEIKSKTKRISFIYHQRRKVSLQWNKCGKMCLYGSFKAKLDLFEMSSM